ncbi:hypothetical protein GCM10020001_006750 [Nonomuraea salmonea]
MNVRDTREDWARVRNPPAGPKPAPRPRHYGLSEMTHRPPLGVGRQAVTRAGPQQAAGPRGGGRAALPSERFYRYWPVLATVSMDRPASVPCLPETSVRM